MVHPVTLRTTIRFSTPGPSTVTSAIASRMVGIMSWISVRRISMRSIQPPKKPDASPMTTPSGHETATASSPTASDTRPPCSSRLNTSRPM